MGSSSHRLSVLDALRGLAALSVCWFHLTQGNPTFLPSGLLKSSGAFGWLGLEMFFVISGFILPYSLNRSEYRISDYGTFLLKRIIRLDPPYLAAILLVLVLGYMSAAAPGYNGPPFEPSFAQVALHLAYINVLFDYPWLNPVFWTLAIEVQFYLLVGLLFFALVHRSGFVRALTFAGLGGLALVFPDRHFVFHWMFLFMLGIVGFQFRAGIIGWRQFGGWIAVFTFGAWHQGGFAVALTGITVAALLSSLEVSLKPPWLFFGHISYSLYLVHIPVGGRVVNLGERFAHTFPEKIAVLALALAASTGVAWVLYWFVERPSQRWSARIRYRKGAAP